MFAPLAAVVMLFAGWSAYWLFASAAARSYSDTERMRLSRSGVSLGCGEEDWGGYPFRFEFTCTTPVVKLTQGSLSAQRAQLIAQAYNPWLIIALIDGPTEARGFSRAIVFDHGRATASFDVRAPQRPLVSAELPGLAAPGHFSTRQTRFHLRPSGAGGIEMALSGDMLQVAIPDQPPLLLDEAALIFSTRPHLSLEVSTFTLRQRDLKLWGNGRIGLDGHRRIDGKLATETNDIDQLLAAASPYARLDDQDRAAIKTVFGLLGKQVKADLIAKNGELFWGPFRLADLDPLY